MQEPSEKPERYRLFVGCPIEIGVARSLAIFASKRLPIDSYRLVEPEKMHVTLLFFPTVDSAMKAKLLDLTAQVQWDPIAVTTGAVRPFGRSAVGMALNADPIAVSRLEDRLVRASTSAAASDQVDWRSEPLGQMALMLDEPENERKLRRQSQNQPLELHVTLGRKRTGVKGQVPALPKPPIIEFVLDEIALYESDLTPEGSRYTRLA